MVLESLGEKLKESLSKIAKAVFVNDRLIDELVKDIQKALLQADVNVHLVFELTKKIKERVLKDKSKISDQRAHLVSIVYEELTSFLGDEKSEINIVKKKPFKIMMTGLYGSGKCVHPDSKILLKDGNSAKIEDMYDRYASCNDLTVLEDGEIIDISKEHLLIPSFNPKTLKIENKKATHLWKLKGKELLEISLDNGNDFSVKVTPEHPFFVLNNGILEQKRADELSEDNYVAIPNELTYESRDIQLFDDLNKLNLYYYLEPTKAKELVITKYGTIKNLYNNLIFKKNYCKLTMDIKNGKIPISIIDKPNVPYIKIRKYGCTYPVFFPLHLNKELAEFLGYLIGDGYLDKQYIHFSNQDEEVIERIRFLSENLFGIKARISKDKRCKNLYKILVDSKTLVNIFNNLFNIPIGKKGKFIRIPSQILESDLEIIRLFIKAYFDCDASPATKSRNIELISESENLIRDTYNSLLKFGIISTISKKYVKEIPYWRLNINASYAEKYADKIGFSIIYKKNKVREYQTIGYRQGSGKQDLIPVGSLLKDIRVSLGYSCGGIQNKVYSYDRYEKMGIIFRRSITRLVNFYSKSGEGNTFKILNTIKDDFDELYSLYGNAFVNGYLKTLSKESYIKLNNGMIQITKEGQLYLDKCKNSNRIELLNKLALLANSQVSWIRVRSVKKLDYKGYVYDLTVLETHSFIANNIIVHNTTSIGKLAKYYASRGYKVAALGLDVHRPAASEQLKQVCDAVKIQSFIDKDEKVALKIYRKYEKEFLKYDLLLIDTAGRHSLDKDLVKEIKELKEDIDPDEVLLVMNADIGQAAEEVAKGFHEACNVTGIFITKLDGTAKGGGALSGAAVSGANVKFIGVGEKVDDIETFNPKGFVGRLLGMGDLEALLERAKEVIDDDKAEDLSKRFLQGDFTLIDLYEQMQAMNKMGPLSKVLEMVPGMGQLKLPKEALKVQEGKLEHWKHAMNSMTKRELENPEVIDNYRLQRISKGSGVSSGEIRELIKQYRQSKKLMKMVKGGSPEKLMKKLQGRMPGM